MSAIYFWTLVMIALVGLLAGAARVLWLLERMRD